MKKIVFIINGLFLNPGYLFENKDCNFVLSYSILIFLNCCAFD